VRQHSLPIGGWQTLANDEFPPLGEKPIRHSGYPCAFYYKKALREQELGEVRIRKRCFLEVLTNKTIWISKTRMTHCIQCGDLAIICQPGCKDTGSATDVEDVIARGYAKVRDEFRRIFNGFSR